MEKITFKTLTILLVIISFSPMIQSESNPFKQKPHNKKGFIKFTPNDAFGGIQAQGKYKKRGKTATITNGDTIYSFDTITENPNPSLLHNKLNLIGIGFFSNKTTRANMPITTHLFGLPTNDATRSVVQNLARMSQVLDDQLNNNDDIFDQYENVDAAIIFKPAKQFSGKGLIGNYSSSTHTATIHDPSSKNGQNYTFEKVQEKSITPLSAKTNMASESNLIGSYTSSSQCSNGTPKICSHAVRLINLYGTLQENQ